MGDKQGVNRGEEEREEKERGGRGGGRESRMLKCD